MPPGDAPSKDPLSLTVGITGATGYVGGVLARSFATTGARVIGLTRSESTLVTETRPFVLGEVVPCSLLHDIDVLIHVAWDFQSRSSQAVDRNVVGSRQLFEAAERAGVQKMLFVSSLAASPTTTQRYGRSKFLSEGIAFAAGARVVRPGLIYGDAAGGMVGVLRKLVHLPIVPVVAPQARVFVLHEDDLAAAVHAIVDAPATPIIPLGLAAPDPVSFADVLHGTARHEGRRPLFVPISAERTRSVVAIAERAGIARSALRVDALYGLLHPPAGVPNYEDVKRLGVHLRPWSW